MRTSTTTADARELRLQGASTSQFDTALAALLDARRDYDALRGNAEQIRDLSAARFRLDQARHDIHRVRLSVGI